MIKTYCINLERATDRRLQIEQEFAREHLDVEFIKAFDSKANGVTQEDVRWEIHPGEFGCLKSNYMVWEDMIIHDHPYALVIEDDIKLVPEFKNKIESLKLPPVWDIIYLEYVSPIFENEFNEDLNEGRCLGTMCYMISLECAKKLVRFDPKDWRGADKQLCLLPLKFFYTKERFAVHDLLNSGIGVEIDRIPVLHNSVWVERKFGRVIALLILVFLLYVLYLKNSGWIQTYSSTYVSYFTRCFGSTSCSLR